MGGVGTIWGSNFYPESIGRIPLICKYDHEKSFSIVLEKVFYFTHSSENVMSLLRQLLIWLISWMIIFFVLISKQEEVNLFLLRNSDLGSFGLIKPRKFWGLKSQNIVCTSCIISQKKRKNWHFKDSARSLRKLSYINPSGCVSVDHISSKQLDYDWRSHSICG